MAIGKATIDIVARTTKFKSAMAGVTASLKKTERAMNAVAKQAKRVFLVGSVAIGGLLKLASDQEKAEAKLEAVLTATGHAAGFSAEQLKIQASALQTSTALADDAFLTMQALLATFKEVRGDEFIRATKAIADMAAVMETDLKSAALQTGKALNDPVLGVAALQRVGVQFNKVQREMITNLVQAGDIMGAQNIILTELEGQFGGAAEAMGQTFGGSIKQVINLLGDLGEKFGSVIGEMIKPGLDSVNESLNQWNEFFAKTDIPKLALSMWLDVKANTFEILDSIFGRFERWRKVAANTFTLIADTMLFHFQNMVNIAETAWAAIKAIFTDDTVGDVWVRFRRKAEENLDLLQERVRDVAAENKKILETPGRLGRIVIEARAQSRKLEDEAMRAALDVLNAGVPTAVSSTPRRQILPDEVKKAVAKTQQDISGQRQGLVALFDRIQGSAARRNDPGVIAAEDTADNTSSMDDKLGTVVDTLVAIRDAGGVGAVFG